MRNKAQLSTRKAWNFFTFTNDRLIYLLNLQRQLGILCVNYYCEIKKYVLAAVPFLFSLSVDDKIHMK